MLWKYVAKWDCAVCSAADVLNAAVLRSLTMFKAVFTYQISFANALVETLLCKHIVEGAQPWYDLSFVWISTVPFRLVVLRHDNLVIYRCGWGSLACAIGSLCVSTSWR